MVECEYGFGLCDKEIFIVLIDTWWNVNVTCGKNSPLMETVLIDTWWNVNMLPLCVSSKVSGFNRYMVECELLK